MQSSQDTTSEKLNIPLTSVPAGQRVRVALVDAGQGLKARLSAMGLTQGMTAEVLASSGGPVILCVLGSRLVLGHRMATHILVRTLPASAI